MACPFFLPIEKLENGDWLHAGRLPLGGGWSGQCTAPGHEVEVPSPERLRDSCNLGYAESCPRLPPGRDWDSVRFAARTISAEGNDPHRGYIRLVYVCERAHRPAEHGMLMFDTAGKQWKERHRDHRVQRMAECFVETYVEKRKGQEIVRAAS